MESLTPRPAADESPTVPGRAGRAAVVLVLVVLAAVGIAACGDDGSDASGTTAPRSKGTASTSPGSGLGGTSWSLRDPVADTEPTLDFAADGKLAGSTGCNRIAGTYDEDGAALRIELGPMTQMACLSDEANRQEQEVVAALGAVRGARRSADSLVLLDGSGAELLTYVPVSGELSGTSWKVLGVNTGSALETSALTEALTMEFGADGTVSGFGGCNRYSGPYTQDGTSLSIGELDSDSASCDDEVTAMEDAFFAALAASSTIERSGSSLTLRDDGGAMQVTATLAG